MQNLLVVNVGNTHTQTALWDGAAFLSLSTRPTKGLSVENFQTGHPCAAASVVPSAEGLLRDAGAFLLSPSCKTGLGLDGMDVSTLGADRLANAISLSDSGPLPALCVDFGTAITFEILDGEKNLRGGAILPGRNLQRRALNSYTAKLPLIELREATLSMPGKNTADAIALGVDLGLVGAVRELVASTAALFPDKPLRRVACGGDAPFFLKAMPGVFEPGGPFLTLYGIAKAWEMNKP